MIADRYVPTLSDLRFGHIARTQQTHQRSGIGTDDLDLALCSHIPDRDALHQASILLIRITEMSRNVHVVVDRKAGHSRGYGRVEIR